MRTGYPPGLKTGGSRCDQTYHRPVAAEIGKVALNMLGFKGVSESLSVLLRTRI